MFSICSGGPCSNKAHPPTLHGSMFTNALTVFNCTILLQHLKKNSWHVFILSWTQVQTSRYYI